MKLRVSGLMKASLSEKIMIPFGGKLRPQGRFDSMAGPLGHVAWARPRGWFSG